ncbi:outer membrane beta-barrel protein [Acidobacteriota bacterium]
MRKDTNIFPNKGVVIIGIIVILSVLPLSGQSFKFGYTWLGENLEEIINATMGNIGPFRYDATFSLAPRYSSDIFFGQGQNPVPDYIFSASPNLSIFLPFKNGIVFDISDTPNYVFYFNTERERTLNNTFQARVHLAFDMFYFQFGTELTNARQRWSTEAFFNVRRKVNNFTGLAFWQISESSALELQHQFSKFEYDSPSGLNIDWFGLSRLERLSVLKAYYKELKRMRFFISAEHGAYAFKESISFQRNALSYGVSGGIEFKPLVEDSEKTRTFQGQIQLGYKYFDVIDPHEIDFKGLVGSTRFSINILKFTALRVMFSRSINFSIYSDLNYYISTSIGAGIERFITKKILAFYNFSFSLNDYVQSEESSFSQANRRFLSHDFSITFLMKGNIGLEVLAGIEERSIDRTRQIYRRYFMGFNLTWH